MASVRILISAGEASGEMYGALLMDALQRLAGESPATTLDQKLEFFGVGGDRMRAAGCDTVVDAKDLAVVGISEILSHLPKIWGLFHKLIEEADRRKPDLAIVIDSPAFNWRVARQMHKRGIPVVYYVCPQFWAWRQGRVRLLRKYVDKALVIFPFEEKFYRDRGVDAIFVGHPLADLPRPEIDRAAYATQHQLDAARPWITLMPGSRVKEVRMNLPVILESAASLGPAYEFLLPVAPTLDRSFLQSLLPQSSDRGPALHTPGSGNLARSGPVARRDRGQRHRDRRGGNDGNAVRDGLPGLAFDLPAGAPAGQSTVLCHGEPDCRRRGCARAGTAGLHR